MNALEKAGVVVLMIVVTISALLLGMKYGNLDKYPRAAYVVEIRESEDIVITEDAVGFQWRFEGISDYAVGDLLILTIKKEGDPSTIIDDRVIDAVYSGFYR